MEVRCGSAQGDDKQHNEDGRDRQPERNAAAVFRSEEVDDPDDENESHGGDLGVLARNAEIADRRPAAQRRRDHEIRDEQECAGGGEKAALLARRGIDTAAIRKMRADDDVVVGDDGGQDADRENDGERREAGGDEGEADNVGLARAPVAVEQGGGALPVDVARTVNARGERKISHGRWSGDSSGRGHSRQGLSLPPVSAARPGRYP